jgi:hypothetical protein
MIRARKEVYRKGCHKITLIDDGVDVEVSILEDTGKVDGIGGMLWDGTLAACEVLKQVDLKDKNILELGCGAGLFGIYAARKNARRVVMTDQEIDLAQENNNMATSQSPFRTECSCFQLEWGVNVPMEIKTCCYDVIVGCEVACLYKQQKALAETIREVSSANTVIIITFDGAPPPDQSKYETSFNDTMASMGYRWKCVGHYRVDWQKDENGESGDVYYSALRNLLPTSTGTFLQSNPHSCVSSAPTDSGDALTSPPCYTFSEELCEHHVLAYFLPIATATCSTCHTQFLPLLNASNAHAKNAPLDCCVYHTGYYVCRCV